MKIKSMKLSLALAAAASLLACGEADDLASQLKTKTGNTDGLKVTGDLTDLSGRGEWGGLALSGYGQLNDGDDNNQAASEAVPDGVTRYFGGTNNADSSGTVQYVVLAETGEAFRPDEEVQGLTVEAAGSGTKLSYIQVTNSDDDGVEWFGGAAAVDHLLVQGQSDDGLDIDLGYQGTIQYALVILGDAHGDKGIESDNNSNFGALPKSSPVIANLTILGDYGDGGSADANTTVLHREGFGGQVYRSAYSDNLITGGKFEKGCLDLDDELDEDLFYGDVVFNCVEGVTADDDTFAQDFTLGTEANIVYDDTLTIDADTLAINSPAFSKTNYSAELAAAGLDDTNYVGAIDPAASEGWFSAWAIRQIGIEGNLPGSPFHPLQAEIEDGTITPAATNGCADLGENFEAGQDVDVFGKTFPVCVVTGSILEDVTLANTHVYLLDGTVNVGNGDTESASDKSSVTSAKLTIDAGTQVFGISGTASALVITRGSTIAANGTAELPIIFGGVTAE